MAKTADDDGPERTEDGRYIIVGGRRWRASDPEIPENLRAELVAELMDARRAVKAGEPEARRRVGDAKHALAERGQPWWEEPTDGGFSTRTRATVHALLRRRAGKSICPSDAARVVGGTAWRDRLDAVRDVVAEMADSGEVRVTQKGHDVDPRGAKGPVRIIATDVPDEATP